MRPRPVIDVVTTPHGVGLRSRRATYTERDIGQVRTDTGRPGTPLRPATPDETNVVTAYERTVKRAEWSSTIFADNLRDTEESLAWRIRVLNKPEEAA